jgi:hypothetical protein
VQSQLTDWQLDGPRPVGVGARGQGLVSVRQVGLDRSRMLCHSLARVVKQHLWLELGPPATCLPPTG